LTHRHFCGDDLAAKLPDLRRLESIDEWSKRTPTRARASDEAIAEFDLYYCLTWGLADANLRGTTAPGAPQYLYWQRRRAFEFAFGDNTDIAHRDWDDIDLST
jgi:hypothetical protein